MKVFIVLLTVALIIILGPLLIIWCLNTAFPALAITYGVDTWFAVAVLSSLIYGRVSK